MLKVSLGQLKSHLKGMGLNPNEMTNLEELREKFEDELREEKRKPYAEGANLYRQAINRMEYSQDCVDDPFIPFSPSREDTREHVKFHKGVVREARSTASKNRRDYEKWKNI